MKKTLTAFLCATLILTTLLFSGCSGGGQNRDLSRFWQTPTGCSLSYTLWEREFRLEVTRSESAVSLTFLAPQELEGIALTCGSDAVLRLTAGNTQVPVKRESLPVLYGLIAPFLPGIIPAFSGQKEESGHLYAACELDGVTYDFEFSPDSGLPTAMRFEAGADGVPVNAVIGVAPGQEADET